MKGFKRFEKDFSCRGKQYEENTTYEEHGVGCCHKGVAEWVKDEEKGRYVPVCVKTERVDGEKIKEDTYYTLKNGEFVEVEE